MTRARKESPWMQTVTTLEKSFTRWFRDNFPVHPAEDPDASIEGPAVRAQERNPPNTPFCCHCSDIPVYELRLCENRNRDQLLLDRKMA